MVTRAYGGTDRDTHTDTHPEIIHGHAHAGTNGGTDRDAAPHGARFAALLLVIADGLAPITGYRQARQLVM